MYTGLLHTHSWLRYAVFIFLLIVIIKSLLGWLGKKPFASIDNKLSLWLLIATHIQFLIGLFLYAVSPFVVFGASTMKDTTTRYWTVEHAVMMLIAVVLITVARSRSKKAATATGKHKILFLLNLIAFIIIIVTINMGGRGLIGGL
jgi:peptidoglycan/LPS O-acetylase OafA/YrhL